MRRRWLLERTGRLTDAVPTWFLDEVVIANYPKKTVTAAVPPVIEKVAIHVATGTYLNSTTGMNTPEELCLAIWGMTIAEYQRSSSRFG